MKVEESNYISLDVPAYEDNPERNKHARKFGASIQEKTAIFNGKRVLVDDNGERYEAFAKKDVYENTPELQVYGLDKRLYIDIGKAEKLKTISEIKEELLRNGIRNALKFDEYNMPFVAGYAIQDNPNIVDFIKNFPNVHGVGTLKEVVRAKEERKELKTKALWQVPLSVSIEAGELAAKAYAKTMSENQSKKTAERAASEAYSKAVSQLTEYDRQTQTMKRK